MFAAPGSCTALCFCADAVVFREKFVPNNYALLHIFAPFEDSGVWGLVWLKTRRRPFESDFAVCITYSSSQRSRIRRSVFSMPRHGSVMDCP